MASVGDPIPAGWSNYKFNLVCQSTGTAIDINDVIEGVPAHNWTYSDTNENQVWLLSLIDVNANVWTIQSVRSQHYLEVENGSASPGANLLTRSRCGSEDLARHNQEWYIYLAENGGGTARVCLQNVASGNFVNLTGNNGADGNKICSWPWDRGLNAVWRLVQQI